MKRDSNSENINSKSAFVTSERLAFADQSDVSTFKIGQIVLVQAFDPLLDEALQLVHERGPAFRFNYVRAMIAEVPCKENKWRLV